jgi:hypothetical protein
MNGLISDFLDGVGAPRWVALLLIYLVGAFALLVAGFFGYGVGGWSALLGSFSLLVCAVPCAVFGARRHGMQRRVLLLLPLAAPVTILPALLHYLPDPSIVYRSDPGGALVGQIWLGGTAVLFIAAFALGLPRWKPQGRDEPRD